MRLRDTTCADTAKVLVSHAEQSVGDRIVLGVLLGFGALGRPSQSGWARAAGASARNMGRAHEQILRATVDRQQGRPQLAQVAWAPKPT